MTPEKTDQADVLINNHLRAAFQEADEKDIEIPYLIESLFYHSVLMSLDLTTEKEIVAEGLKEFIDGILEVEEKT